MKADKLYQMSDRMFTALKDNLPDWQTCVVDMHDMSPAILAEIKVFGKTARGRLARFSNSRSIMFEFEEDAMAWLLKYS